VELYLNSHYAFMACTLTLLFFVRYIRKIVKTTISFGACGGAAGQGAGSIPDGASGIFH
jgi:hypothetical protein